MPRVEVTVQLPCCALNWLLFQARIDELDLRADIYNLIPDRHDKEVTNHDSHRREMLRIIHQV